MIYLLGGTIRVSQDVLGKVRTLPDSPLIFRARGTQSRDAREEIRNDRNDLIDGRRLRV